VIAGIVLIAWGLLAFPAAPLGYAIAAGGVTAILTGFFGFCPMCAMVGRKLPSAWPRSRRALSKGLFAEFL
jgi:hypothetical protein